LAHTATLIRHYTFHGLRLTLSGNPVTIAPVHARLQQLPPPGSNTPDLLFEFSTISTSANHRIAKPTSPTRPVYNPPVGEVAYSDREELLYLAYGDRLRVLCDPRQGKTYLSVMEPNDEDLWVLSHPLFTIPFLEMLKRRGRYSLHAAGLCINGRGLIFPGTSGSGKSTLTLALVRAGFGFLGDDTLFLTQNHEGVQVLAFPDEIDVTEATINLFPELHSLLRKTRPSGWPKRQIRADECYGVPCIWECRPAAVIFPSVAHKERSVLQPLDRDTALLELVPNVLLTEPRSSQAHLDVLTTFVQNTPCYRLETGRDFDRLPHLLRSVVE
jgi:hypothetical protein